MTPTTWYAVALLIFGGVTLWLGHEADRVTKRLREHNNRAD